MWFWGPGWGWLAGLLAAAFWIALIAAAVLFLRHELPNLNRGPAASPALRTLEERYARGEIDREEFLHRREVLLAPAQAPRPGRSEAPATPPPPAPPPGGSGSGDPTIPLEESPPHREFGPE